MSKWTGVILLWTGTSTGAVVGMVMNIRVSLEKEISCAERILSLNKGFSVR